MPKEITIDKTELQQLRTKNNLLLKCIRHIRYITDHIHEGPYDYGEANDKAITEIKDAIDTYDYKIK